MLTPEHWYSPRLSCDEPFAEIACKAPHLIYDIANGCGDGWRDRIVPDTMYGLSIRPACQIHDWDYHHGSAIEHKDEAD